MGKVAITNVRVFDGQEICQPTTVVIDCGLIAEDTTGAEVIDGKGGVILPGFIDAHVHLHGEESLKELAQWGVTTGLDMACWPVMKVQSLRVTSEDGGITDFRTPGLPATAPGSLHSHMPHYPKEELVASEEDARKYVERRVAEKVDYLKIIADLPGFEQNTINALVSEAKKHGTMTIAHAAQYAAYERAIAGGVDFVTHVPLDKTLDKSITDALLSRNIVAIPTLSMMKKVYTNLKRPGTDYIHARDGVTAMHQAGVPILVGTDANMAPGAPAQVRHGESLHGEFELLIEAGLSNLEVLRAATVGPAKYFGLSDRGAIEVGKRADLVLIRGNPLEDITNTRNIERVWCKGVEI